MPDTLPPLITLEEHFVSQAALAAGADYDEYGPVLRTKITGLDDTRLRDMDAGGVAVQVVSHGPERLTPAQACAANDELHAAVQRHPTRLRGFAVLPMGDPSAAAAELTRCMRELRFVGALVNNHDGGTFYDGPAYAPFWAAAEDLGAPIYLHPTHPSDAMHDVLYTGAYPDAIAHALGAFGWGWHAATGLHFLRLYAAGVFERHPRLKVVLGHMGELLPFQLDRIAPMFVRWGGHTRSLKEVWAENIWITTSGMFSLAPLACVLRVCARDRILYSVDYPFSANERGREFVKEIVGSGLMSEEDVKDFAYRNAEKLLSFSVHA
jgi:predicted TIM-barrel fold metal-dependent hydrolase